jgi:DNA invertase Pin-like site-specific DNA recombinase
VTDSKYRKYGISYIRFSTEKQALGHSYQRQFEEADKYCSERGIELIKEYKDLGRSAYKSFHLLPDAGLGYFLKKLRKGEIPNVKDTYLVIESLDRLSRANVSDSLPIFIDILKQGIAIITLSDQKIYEFDKEKTSDMMQQLILSVMMLSKAHQESLDKSFRIGRAWKAKKEKARVQAKSGNVEALTRMCPFWLRVKKNKGKLEYVKKEDYISTIKLIFDLATGEYSKEKYNDLHKDKLEKFEKTKIRKQIDFEIFHLSLSSNEIVKVLNSSKIPILKSGKRKKTDYWNTSNINKILINKALIGEYQPQKLVDADRKIFDEDKKEYQIIVQTCENDGETIKDFYPEIISPEQFTNAQRFKSKRLRGRKGRKGNKFSNLFNGLAVCRNCGSNMVHNDKGTSASGNRWVYLQCSLARVGGDCKYESIKYDIAEYNFLRFIQGSDFKPIIGSSDLDQEKIDQQSLKIELIQEELAEINRLYIKHIEADYNGFEEIKVQKIKELQKKKAEHISSLNGEELELNILISNKITEKFDKKSFSRLLKEIDLNSSELSNEDIYFNRMKVNSIISNLIDKLHVDTIRKKLSILYKDGTGQIINIDHKFDDNESANISVRIPRFVFPKDMLDKSKPKFTEATNNVCMLILDQCYKLKSEGKYSFATRNIIINSKMKEVISYLSNMANLNGYSFRFEKSENIFFIEQ